MRRRLPVGAEQGNHPAPGVRTGSLSLRERAGVREATRTFLQVEDGFRPKVGKPGFAGLSHSTPLPKQKEAGIGVMQYAASLPNERHEPGDGERNGFAPARQ